MNSRKFLLPGLVLAISLNSVSAQADEPKYMRSSIYSILVNSDEQNTRLDEEARTSDPEAYSEALTGSGLTSLGQIPSLVFPTLAIPEQFNDHNLDVRVVDFDRIASGISEEQAKAAAPKSNAAKSMLKGLGASAVGKKDDNNSSIVRVEKVDDYIYAALNSFFDQNNVAPMLVAKWYNYDAARQPQFNEEIILERGLDNASASELAKAAANDDARAMLSAQGFKLLDNTYVVATNLRFRNNKALAQEIAALAAVAGSAAGARWGLGSVTGAATQLATEAATNALMKDAYSVTAVTNLYKLDWNDDIDAELGEKVLYNENATLQDLLDSNLCKLTFVGQSKARSGVKKDKTKTLTDLASSATGRAIDKALAKLQVDHEAFRTIVPVSKCADGYVYAKIGTKEGVTTGDEYEILEQQLNPKTKKIEYKKVGSAKAEDNEIWFNTSGADELIANAEEAEAAEMKKAQELGYTKFKSDKKDYSGNYLRLKKKKGKIED